MGLTMLRLLLLPVFLWIMLIDAGPVVAARPHRWWAMGIFAVMALTDKLDGYLARRLNQTTHLGTILDPLADKLLIACSTILLSFGSVASAGYKIPLPVVAAIYAKDVIVAMGILTVMSVVGRVAIRARLSGKLSTVLQLALVIATLIAPDLERIGRGTAMLILRSLWWVVSLIAVLACLDYVMEGIRQFRAKRVRPQPAGKVE